MNWQELCNRPDLHNLPFKIELDEQGRIIMSPVKVYHSALQGEIAAILRLNRKDGRILTECAIQTRKGTKVTDVSWASAETYQVIKNEAECPVAPEVCIEVLSSSNTAEEIAEKKILYFEKGALEVWLCHRDGSIYYFDPQGEMTQSAVFPGFPRKVDLDV
ncbi:MAG: Uma2 family endonuclease [Pseudomonadota bacterium]|nr:Uma2 family endonuclease [Pseudomonadota bacterium]